ncbi:UPF0348 protein family [Alkalibacterium sp. AK22]|uniref:nucleotidyltransferase n=1 Tax=Alkalibacterium sp. AK22 TaxID=1229520 RepID=UPI00044D4F19|nr:nucleotidyltransferase [Alkalibacterium sp. AK22]EXJ22864.1 UPF0348 protein family [Alkalibacterium sp. AK22]
MMKVCGVIAEYNPFHNGHRHHLEEARRQTGADIIIVVMSGNFLQRGEPAIVDKWVRAEAALTYGADIVVELPVDHCVQPADHFAEAGVSILAGLGCELISFGSEAGEASSFTRAADLYLTHEEAINKELTATYKQDMTYAQNFSRVMSRFFQDFPIDLLQPNNILGFAYAKAIVRRNYPINLHTIPRLKSHYHDQSLDKEGTVASATAIRRNLLEEKFSAELASRYMPDLMTTYIKERPLVSWEAFFPLLNHQLIILPEEQLMETYLMETGLEYRLKNKIKEARSMQEFMENMKTRQVSWTTLQRLCLHVLLGNKTVEMHKRMRSIEAVRLLGFNASGRRYISKAKKTFQIELVSNVNKKTARMIEQDILAGEVYRLADKNRIRHQDFYTSPLNLIDKQSPN